MKKVNIECRDGSATLDVVDDINEITDSDFEDDDWFEPAFFGGYKSFEEEKEEIIRRMTDEGETSGDPLHFMFSDCDPKGIELNKDHDGYRFINEDGVYYHLDVLKEYGKDFLELLSSKKQYRTRYSMYFIFEHNGIVYSFHYDN